MKAFVPPNFYTLFVNLNLAANNFPLCWVPTYNPISTRSPQPPKIPDQAPSSALHHSFLTASRSYSTLNMIKHDSFMTSIWQLTRALHDLFLMSTPSARPTRSLLDCYPILSRPAIGYKSGWSSTKWLKKIPRPYSISTRLLPDQLECFPTFTRSHPIASRSHCHTIPTQIFWTCPKHLGSKPNLCRSR